MTFTVPSEESVVSITVVAIYIQLFLLLPNYHRVDLALPVNSATVRKLSPGTPFISVVNDVKLSVFRLRWRTRFALSFRVKI